MRKVLSYALIASLLLCFLSCSRRRSSEESPPPGDESGEAGRYEVSDGLIAPEPDSPEGGFMDQDQPFDPGDSGEYGKKPPPQTPPAQDPGDGKMPPTPTPPFPDKVRPPKVFRETPSEYEDPGGPIPPPEHDWDPLREQYDPDDPVPEPSTIILMASGLAFLFVYLLVRKKKQVNHSSHQ